MVDVQHGDLRAHAQRHLGCVGAHRAAAQDRHVGRSHPRHTTQQHPTPAMMALKITRTHLCCHAPCHLAHGHQQRQFALAGLHCLIGNGGNATFKQGIGQLAVGSQMQIGKEQLIGAQKMIFAGDRLLDLDHHLRCPGVGGGWHNLCPSSAIFVVAQKAAHARARFHQDLMAASCQRLDRARGQPHTVLAILDLFGQPNSHSCAPSPTRLLFLASLETPGLDYLSIKLMQSIIHQLSTRK